MKMNNCSNEANYISDFIVVENQFMNRKNKLHIKYLIYGLLGLSSFLSFSPYVAVLIAIELGKRKEFYGFLRDLGHKFGIIDYSIVIINTGAISFFITCIVIFFNSDATSEFLNRRPLTFETVFVRVLFCILLILNGLGVILELLSLGLNGLKT
jgi:hypothetical protein